MQKAFFALITRCATDLPEDVEIALRKACSRENSTSTAARCLATILDNSAKARIRQAPLCQDTGVPLFFVQVPDGYKTGPVQEAIREAVREATAKGFLRPNCVDTLTETSRSDNIGPDFPVIKITAEERTTLRVGLLLKGGGSENVSAQYKLPDSGLQAERGLEGVRKAVLKAVHGAQGRGCAPGIIGVGIGGDRELSYATAKKQLFRRLDHVNPDAALAALETRLTDDLNGLAIGPMGLGGATTVLGVKIGTADRHPACYYVTAAYLCWAARRYTIEIKSDGSFEYT